MIRDEFKNADKKVLKKKTNKKMQQLGERAYYAKKLATYNDMLKPIRFSTIFCTVSFVLVAGLYLFSSIVTKQVETVAIILFIVAGLCIAWCVVWFAFLAPYIKNKIVEYKAELTKMNNEYVMKSRKIK